MTNPQTHVAVLMGGWSSEREVSLRSGEACAKALEAQGYKATRLDVGRDVATRLTELRPDVCFNALHGRFGEDGCIQGVLETLGIPYTHSGVLASALAMHKERAKIVMRSAGVPVAESLVVTREEAARAHAMKPPYVIKPVTEGSSVGVFIVREDQRHPPQTEHQRVRHGDDLHHTVVDEALHALADRGLGQPDRRGEPGVRRAAVDLELLDDRPVDVVEVRTGAAHV